VDDSVEEIITPRLEAKSIFYKKTIGVVIAELQADKMKLTYYNGSGNDIFNHVFYPNKRNSSF